MPRRQPAVRGWLRQRNDVLGGELPRPSAQTILLSLGCAPGQYHSQRRRSPACSEHSHAVGHSRAVGLVNSDSKHAACCGIGDVTLVQSSEVPCHFSSLPVELTPHRHVETALVARSVYSVKGVGTVSADRAEETDAQRITQRFRVRCGNAIYLDDEVVVP